MATTRRVSLMLSCLIFPLVLLPMKPMADPDPVQDFYVSDAKSSTMELVDDCPPPRTKQDATPAPMEKGGSGKLSKLKCMIKRWNSSGRIARSTSAARGAAAGGDGASLRTSPDEERWKSASFHGDAVPPGFHAVYVGKSRRRYLVNSGLVDHPLFRVLVERCSVDGDGGADAATVVGCEVVLFEHLLWMLENADPQPESLDELVDFYAC